eukprot:UN15539
MLSSDQNLVPHRREWDKALSLSSSPAAGYRRRGRLHTQGRTCWGAARGTRSRTRHRTACHSTCCYCS